MATLMMKKSRRSSRQGLLLLSLLLLASFSAIPALIRGNLANQSHSFDSQCHFAASWFHSSFLKGKKQEKETNTFWIAPSTVCFCFDDTEMR